MVDSSPFVSSLVADAEGRAESLFKPVSCVDGLVWNPKWLGPAKRDDTGSFDVLVPDDTGVDGEGSVFLGRVKRMLTVLCGDPVIRLTDLYELCGFGSKQCVAVKDYLLSEGLASLEKVRTGLRGKTFECLELTSAGVERAESFGLTYVRLTGRGSFEHRYHQMILAAYWRDQGFTVRLEGDPGKGDFADLSLEKDGLRVAVELERSSRTVLGNIERDVGNGYEAVIVVVLTARLERAVRRVIDSLSDDVRERVLVQRMENFL